MEQMKKQPAPVIGSTRNPERGPMPRLVQVGDVAYCQNKNNTRIIAAHYYGGLRESTGEVTMTYYGMSAFQVNGLNNFWLFSIQFYHLSQPAFAKDDEFFFS